MTNKPNQEKEDKDKIIPYATLRQYMANMEVLMDTHDILLKLNQTGVNRVTGACRVDDETEKILGKINLQLDTTHKKLRKFILNHF